MKILGVCLKCRKILPNGEAMMIHSQKGHHVEWITDDGLQSESEPDSRKTE